jgi:hypothetical protein
MTLDGTIQPGQDAPVSDSSKWCPVCRRRGYASAACWAGGLPKREERGAGNPPPLTRERGRS